MRALAPLHLENLEHVLVPTWPHWERFCGGRIFVTRSTGFFGIWLLKSFAHANKSLDLGAKLVGLYRGQKINRQGKNQKSEKPEGEKIVSGLINYRIPVVETMTENGQNSGLQISKYPR